MPAFYNQVIQTDARISPYYNEDNTTNNVIIQDDSENNLQGLTNKVAKDMKDAVIVPTAIMNDNVGINYRTIFNGNIDANGECDFTLLSDYNRCMAKNNIYLEYLKDKKNPTYANIMKYYNNPDFDNAGLANYKMQDFIYLKYYNQIPNNYMITLRRYPIPCQDHMFNLMTTQNFNAIRNGTENSYQSIATAVTYMGEQSGNKLSDILRFDYGANWEKKTAEITQLQSSDGGLKAQLDKWKFTQGAFDGNTKASLITSIFAAGKGISVSKWQQSQHQYDANEFFSKYGEQFYGDLNVIQDVSLRSRGLTFNNSFDLVFEYSLKSLKYVNPRVAMLDILSNFMLLTGNYGKFWGGETIYYGTRTIAPQYGNPALLREGKYGSYMMSIVRDAKSAFQTLSSNFTETVTDKNGNTSTQYTWNGALNGLLSTLKGGISTVLGNLLGGKIGIAGEAQSPRALLSGEPTGYWHLTIGNPLDPIAVMGNMKIEKTSVEFSDALGYDDFPTEVKFTVSLEHARPRDNEGIQSMFNAGNGRFYTLDAGMEKTLGLDGKDYVAKNFKDAPNKTQESAHTSNHNGQKAERLPSTMSAVVSLFK